MVRVPTPLNKPFPPAAHLTVWQSQSVQNRGFFTGTGLDAVLATVSDDPRDGRDPRASAGLPVDRRGDARRWEPLPHNVWASDGVRTPVDQSAYLAAYRFR